MVGKKPTINLNHLKRFLINGYKSLHKYKETFYEEINELSKGKFTIIDFKLKLNEQSYWKPNYRINKKLTFEDSKTLIKETLINSVEKQLQADVPLAFCMSGGIDSNALMAIAKKYLIMMYMVLLLIAQIKGTAKNQLLTPLLKI